MQVLFHKDMESSSDEMINYISLMCISMQSDHIHTFNFKIL